MQWSIAAFFMRNLNTQLNVKYVKCGKVEYRKVNKKISCEYCLGNRNVLNITSSSTYRITIPFFIRLLFSLFLFLFFFFYKMKHVLGYGIISLNFYLNFYAVVMSSLKIMYVNNSYILLRNFCVFENILRHFFEKKIQQVVDSLIDIST